MLRGKLSELELTFIVYLSVKTQIFFISTQSCRLRDAKTPCDQTSLGKMSFIGKKGFIAPVSFQTRSAPGYRITRYIDPSIFTSVDLEKYANDQNAIRAHAIANYPEDHGRFHVKVYIYCPPCACQIATALDICLYRDKKDFVDFCIRVDHRLKTSCSASSSRIEGLVSVIDYITSRETGDSLADLTDKTIERLKAIDREWIERQIYDYTEADRFQTLSPASQLARIARLHEKEYSMAAIIMLGGADYSLPLMKARPFCPFESGRLPRENQIFRNLQSYKYSPSNPLWKREFLGTYSAKDPLPPNRPAPVDSNTAQTSEGVQRGSKRPRSLASDEEGS